MKRWIPAIVSLIWAMSLARAETVSDLPVTALASDVPEAPAIWGLYTFEGKADLEQAVTPAGPTQVGVQSVDATASLSVVSNRAMTFMAGAYWRWDRFDLSGGYNERYDLYVAAVPLNLFYTGFEDWLFWGNVTPGLFTDFQRLTHDDYRTTGHAMVQYDWTRAFRLAAGLAYDREFGDDKLYPIGGIVWDINRAWQLNLIFPWPQIAYAPWPGLVLFVDARPAGNKWNVHYTGDVSDYDLKVESWQVGGGLEYQLWKQIWLHASAGADVRRHYEIRLDDDSRIDSDAGDTYYLRAGLVVR